MSIMQFANKTPDQLHEERLAMLIDIAKELEGEVIFPICFDASVQISTVMKSKTASLQRIAHEVQKDPLITAKLLKMANSVVFNPMGKTITDLGAALTRLGMETARATALACAMQQLIRSRDLAAFEDIAKELWLHSIKTSMIARVIARRLTRVNPELAMLAGLVHDLGAFFMLDRAGRYPELSERPKTVEYLVAQWHESVGNILLDSLGLPEEIVEAVKEVDLPRDFIETPRNLGEVIYVANLFAGGFSEMQKLDIPDLEEPKELSYGKYTDLSTEMEEACQEMISLF
ncbi:HDOD domain-containing protein [Chitinibacter bivalviorum]|uniref:HDOD domain-containing protein n=1 Tax=Chitinibacter bivalviorum TaxID=2739434 RepID=A0A7H9BPJ7_9NEIS|nr:HDOD domain-containing protein [Chitinibacter bivalviorum]QLG89274.1 HDOD domain-containing protein [Chitinibacter bivalviorum]